VLEPLNCEVETVKVVETVEAVPSKYIQIYCGAGPVQAICDSGAEISVLHTSMINHDDVIFGSEVILQGAFSEQISANTCNVQVKLDNPNAVACTITAAVTPRLQGNTALLTVSDYNALLKTTNSVPKSEFIHKTAYMYTDPDLSEVQNENRRAEICAVRGLDKANVKLTAEENVTHLHSQVITDCSSPEEFLAMQKSDPSLISCWQEADKPKSVFFTDKGYLFRKGEVGHITVVQLVIPSPKRNQLVKHSHDSLYGFHFAKSKTINRLLCYYWWPKIAHDVTEHVANCDPCIRHSRKNKFDRVPISPIALSAESFDHVQVDITGPIAPPSSKQDLYILCVVCVTTKWCEAVPLKSLKAVEVVDALVKIFMHCKIPKLLHVDQASYFTADVSQEVFERLGIEVHYSSPNIPLGHGAVERVQYTLQRMLHHVLNSDKPREWNKMLPFMVHAYNELPHSTTELSPHSMLFGSLPRSPLATLHSYWSKRDTPPVKLNRDCKEYVQTLQENIQALHEIAVECAQVKQQVYTDRYNVDTHEKQFQIGQTVCC
jgi:hypothetical protein